MTKIYHYTKGNKLDAIIASGEIMREGETGNYMFGITPQQLLGLPPMVWLTAEPEMPFTATPRITNEFGRSPFMQYQQSRWRGYKHWAHICGGVFRLAFDAEQIGAQRYSTGPVRAALLANGMLRSFEQVARVGKDDVSKWYHCDERVSLRQVMGIETWQERWVPWQAPQQLAA